MPELLLPSCGDLFFNLSWINRLLEGRWDFDAGELFVEWDDARYHGVNPPLFAQQLLGRASIFVGPY